MRDNKPLERLPIHGARIEKKVSDTLLDLERAKEILLLDGFTAESNQIKEIERITKALMSVSLTKTIKQLKIFAKIKN